MSASGAGSGQAERHSPFDVLTWAICGHKYTREVFPIPCVLPAEICDQIKEIIANWAKALKVNSAESSDRAAWERGRADARAIAAASPRTSPNVIAQIDALKYPVPSATPASAEEMSQEIWDKLVAARQQARKTSESSSRTDVDLPVVGGAIPPVNKSTVEQAGTSSSDTSTKEVRQSDRDAACALAGHAFQPCGYDEQQCDAACRATHICATCGKTREETKRIEQATAGTTCPACKSHVKAVRLCASQHWADKHYKHSVEVPGSCVTCADPWHSGTDSAATLGNCPHGVAVNSKTRCAACEANLAAHFEYSSGSAVAGDQDSAVREFVITEEGMQEAAREIAEGNCWIDQEGAFAAKLAAIILSKCRAQGGG